MDEVWNGLLTCDYEHSRPGSTALEYDLYTTSLIAWPTTLIQANARYGRLRRPGIVDIPKPDHDHQVGLLHAHLTDPARAKALVHRANLHSHRCDAVLTQVEAAFDALDADDAAAATPPLARATTSTLAVMSTHIVNWLLPEQQWEDLLTRLLGAQSAARECIFALTTPPTAGHLLDAHSHLLQTAQALEAGSTALADAAASVTARTGTLYGTGSPAAAPMPLEDPTHAAELLQTTLLSAAPGEQLQQISGARNHAETLAEAWEQAAWLAASGDPCATDQVQALVAVGRWASDSEERRKVLRHRFLAVARRWCYLTGADPRHVTIQDLLAHGAPR